MKQKTHEKWMSYALRLAAKGASAVSPNPMVGACVVKNGRLIASGFHAKFGGSHAERIALERAGRRAKGATLYVTLEPCSSWQKTPPCAPFIVEKGICETVIGVLDPNPVNHRKGLAYLKKHNMRVRVGVLEEKVKEQNEGFFKLMTAKRPFVTLKMAETLDGKIATRQGKSRWISSRLSREFVHQLRTEHDAVLVGKNTFYQDNPRITVPPHAKCLQNGKPWKIAIISDGRLPVSPRMFADERLGFLACPRSKIRTIVREVSKYRGAFNLIPVRDYRSRLDIRDLLRKIGELGVSKLLVEGGGELAWSLIEANCVDRAVWIVAPKIFGGRDARTSVEGTGISSPDRAYNFIIQKILKSGSDLIYMGSIQK